VQSLNVGCGVVVVVFAGVAVDCGVIYAGFRSAVGETVVI